MSLQSLIGSLRRSRPSSTPHEPSSDVRGNNDTLPDRLLDVFFRMWDLGFTAFGGPPVHFQILHRRFVEGKGIAGRKWLDEQAVSNFLRMIVLNREGFKRRELLDVGRETERGEPISN